MTGAPCNLLSVSFFWVRSSRRCNDYGTIRGLSGTYLHIPTQRHVGRTGRQRAPVPLDRDLQQQWPPRRATRLVSTGALLVFRPSHSILEAGMSTAESTRRNRIGDFRLRRPPHPAHFLSSAHTDRADAACTSHMHTYSVFSPLSQLLQLARTPSVQSVHLPRKKP